MPWDVFRLYSLFRCFPSAIKTANQNVIYPYVLYTLTTTVATAFVSCLKAVSNDSVECMNQPRAWIRQIVQW